MDEVRQKRSVLLGALWFAFVVAILIWLLWSGGLILAEIGSPGETNVRDVSALVVTFGVVPVGLVAAGRALVRRQVGPVETIAMLIPLLAIVWWSRT